MGFWFGTLVFFAIQLVVTVSINTLAKRPNKGCVLVPVGFAMDAGRSPRFHAHATIVISTATILATTGSLTCSASRRSPNAG